MTTDRIHIRDLMISCIVGTKPDERVHKQNVTLNLTLESDLSDAARSDSIEDTVNYQVLKNEIVALVEKSEYFLIETLSTKVAELCLSRDGVDAVTVSVDKPGALTKARSVAVEIRREATS